MDVTQIIRVYEKRLRDSPTIKDIAVKAATYKDAQNYSTKTAEALIDVLKRYVDVTALTQDEALELFPAVLERNYVEVVRICANVQQKINKRAGLGLKALEPEFNLEKAQGLATAITDMEEVTDDYIRNLVINNSRSIVDDTVRINAEAEANMGLVVHITRRYDDVGLHGGKDVCQWCLDREGEWDSYPEARAAGVFERHPGCGCVIDYHVGKTRTWSNSKGGWRDV